MKKIASTLLRFGPPLAGEPSVFFGVFEMMFESVRMNVSHMPGLVAEPLDDRERVADRLVLRLAVARVGPREHALRAAPPPPRPPPPPPCRPCAGCALHRAVPCGVVGAGWWLMRERQHPQAGVTTEITPNRVRRV